MNWLRAHTTPQTIIRVGLAVLCAVMPFHAFIVIAAGNSFGHQVLFQAWKEVMILGLSLVALGFLAVRYLDWKALNRRTVYIVAAFTALALLVSFVTGKYHDSSFLYGVKSDLVPLVVFALALLVASNRLEHKLERIVLITGAIVSALGLIQVWLLPPDFLVRFGYSATTILPAQYINPGAQAFPRAFSTLGGPNQLGAFLILPLVLFTARLLRKVDWSGLAGFVIVLTCLIQTNSRSAWIGAAIAGFMTICLHLRGRKLRYFLAASIVIGLIGFSVIRGAIDRNLSWQYYFLHQDGTVYSTQGSDLQRTNWQLHGLDVLRQQPFGSGLGSAGPASRYGAKPLISENYYLQIGLEMGIAGLVLFLLLMLSLGVDFWQSRNISDNNLSLPLLGALIGLSVTNLFLHTWADSTLVLVFWALAGVAVGRRKE